MQARSVLWSVVLKARSGGHVTQPAHPSVQEDVGALRASAAGALQQLEDAGSGQAAAVVGQLAELDRVKRRMEDACNTLKVRGTAQYRREARAQGVSVRQYAWAAPGRPCLSDHLCPAAGCC